MKRLNSMEKYNINKYVRNWAHGKPYYTTTNKYVAHIVCFILQTFSNKRTEYWISRGY